MEDRLKPEELSAFAGHLLAELYAAGDDFQHGRITQQQYLNRVRQIRRRQISGDNGLLRSMETIQFEFHNIRRQMNEVRTALAETR